MKGPDLLSLYQASQAPDHRHCALCLRVPPEVRLVRPRASARLADLVRAETRGKTQDWLEWACVICESRARGAFEAVRALRAARDVARLFAQYRQNRPASALATQASAISACVATWRKATQLTQTEALVVDSHGVQLNSEIIDNVTGAGAGLEVSGAVVGGPQLFLVPTSEGLVLHGGLVPTVIASDAHKAPYLQMLLPPAAPAPAAAPALVVSDVHSLSTSAPGSKRARRPPAPPAPDPAQYVVDMQTVTELLQRKAAGEAEPLRRSDKIDWEDQIPMDVISTMDGTDPLAEEELPTELPARASPPPPQSVPADDVRPPRSARHKARSPEPLDIIDLC